MSVRKLVLAAGALALAACSDAGPAGTSQVAFAVTTKAAVGPSAAGIEGSSELFTDSGGNSLSIDSVSVVVRKLELEGSASACVDDQEPGDTGEVDVAIHPQLSDSGEHEGEDDDCGEVRAGPFLVDLPLGAGVTRMFTVTVDTGTYHEVKFQIHKPDGANDTLFVQQHPLFAGVSIRVVGSFNGTPFTYTTDVTDVQEVEFATPLVVTTDPTAFTVQVDLSGWFTGEGGTLVDPATAIGDGVNVSLVRGNILHSFHAFQDGDHDGEDDHEEGHD